MREIYDRIPVSNLECRGLCHHSCSAIGYSAAERRVIAYKHGNPPLPQGAWKGGKIEIESDLRCSYLGDDKRCEIYEDRPMICRIYGMAKTLPCPHGCRPTEWMDDAELPLLLAALEAIEGIDKLSYQYANAVSTAYNVQQGSALTPIDRWRNRVY